MLYFKAILKKNYYKANYYFIILIIKLNYTAKNMKTYNESINWLFNQLPMYQRVGGMAYKIDLTNTIKLCNYLGNPERKITTIHVAGTNGKGSTSHMLASVFQEAGYRTGLYTSPHLKDFRERIKINGEMMPKDEVVDFVNDNKTFFEESNLSFFEMTVGLAFNYFAKSNVDIAIIETGLGGRLDSTNIVNPMLSVITNIGLDHTALLGNTLTKIATEKAGIIKPYIPVVIGQTQNSISNIFTEKASALNSEIIFADKMEYPDFKTDLLGSYQKHNIKTAVATLKLLQLRGETISDLNIENGLNKVVENTGLMGRWQILSENPMVVCDTAHNVEGLTEVINQIKNTTYNKLHVVLGMVADKDIENVLALFDKNATYYFCEPEIPRALKVDELYSIATLVGLQGNKYNTVKDALKMAKQNAETNDFIYVGGSTFVVAEVV